MLRLRFMSRPALMMLAVLADLLIVMMGNAAIGLALGRPLLDRDGFGIIDAPDVAIMHLVFAGMPMFALALLGIRRIDAWLIAVGLQSAFWCYFAWQIWQDSLTGFAGGANIGVGLIMLASPFFTILVLAGWGSVSRVFRE